MMDAGLAGRGAGAGRPARRDSRAPPARPSGYRELLAHVEDGAPLADGRGGGGPRAPGSSPGARRSWFRRDPHGSTWAESPAEAGDAARRGRPVTGARLEAPDRLRDMGEVHATKHQGAGNDFLVLLDPDDTIRLSVAQVRLLCDRRRGIGADGIIRVARAATAATSPCSCTTRTVARPR